MHVHNVSVLIVRTSLYNKCDQWSLSGDCFGVMTYIVYCIVRKFGGIKFGCLAVYLCDRQFTIFHTYGVIHVPYQTAKFISANILQWQFGAQLLNLIPTNISGSTVSVPWHHRYYIHAWWHLHIILVIMHALPFFHKKRQPHIIFTIF